MNQIVDRSVSFDELGVSPKVLAALKVAGYEVPTPIQHQAIPFILKGKDLLGIAQTGTGKTGAFVLPILCRLEKGRTRARMPRTLIIEPTRELAAQVAESLNLLNSQHNLSIALLIGGVPFDKQYRQLDQGVDVLVATPGRLLDHFERGKLLLTGIEILVIDEADRLLDMGFIPDIERIYSKLPAKRQALFFSATIPPEIKRLVATFLNDPERIEINPSSAVASTVKQSAVSVSDDAKSKRQILRDLIINAEELKNAIIFCNRKRDVTILLRSLQRHKFDACSLHGDMDQRERTRMLDRFRSKGGPTILVASDVAARGLDIEGVSHVFNFNVPTRAEDYVHRIGRTGRAGRTGTAITLVAPSEYKYLNALEKFIKSKLTWEGDPPNRIQLKDKAAEPKHRARNKRKSVSASRTHSQTDSASRTRNQTDSASRTRNQTDSTSKTRNQTDSASKTRNQTDSASKTRSQTDNVSLVAQSTKSCNPASRHKKVATPQAKHTKSPALVASIEDYTPIGLGGHVPSFLQKIPPIGKTE